MTQLGIKYLGLRSLKEISDGDVVIIKNYNLCYTNKSHWTNLFKSRSQSATIEENDSSHACGKMKFVTSDSPSFVVLFCCSVTNCRTVNLDLINQI